MIRTMPLRKSLPDMRKGGLEPPHLITEVADPKGNASSSVAPSGAPEGAQRVESDTTRVHHVTPGITEHVIPGRTRSQKKVRKLRAAWCWLCTKKFRTRANVAKRCPACRAKPGYKPKLFKRRWPASWRCRRELEGAA
jgi:predicted Zn-ribbon and HTH transcriptional regulator